MSSSNHTSGVGGSPSPTRNYATTSLYPKIESSEFPISSDNNKPSTSFHSLNDGVSTNPFQTLSINSDHDTPTVAATAGSSSPQRTMSTGSIQDSTSNNDTNMNHLENPNHDTDSILSSLNRKNKNLAPLFTRDYFSGGNSFQGGGIQMKVCGLGGHSGSMTFPMSYDSQGEFCDYTLNRKGWKGLSPLEKSLSVSLGVVSTLSIALMIAVIVIGVQLNDAKECKVSLTESPLPCPTLPSTTPKDDRCELERPRPPRRTTPRSTGKEKPSYIPSNASCLTQDNTTICLTPACFRISQNILQSIDLQQDPCENFYQFACGGGIKNNPSLETLPDQSRTTHKKLLGKIREILETDSTSASPSRSFQFAQKFYHSCMNPLLDDEVALAEMRVLLETMTSAPSTPAVLDKPPSEISAKLRVVGVVLANIRRFLNENYIIRLDVDKDDMNLEENAIYLSHPEPGMKSLLKELDIIDPEEVEMMQSQQEKRRIPGLYRGLVKKLWSLVYPEDVANLEEILTQMEEFEEKLRRISSDDGANRDNPERSYNPLSELERTGQLSEMMVRLLTEFSTNVIKDRGSDVGTQGQQQMEKIPKVIVKNVNYFKGLEEILKVANREAIGRYLKLRILLTYGPHSGEIFTDLFSDFRRKAEGPENYRSVPRWQTCAHETNSLFGWAISQQLVQTTPNLMLRIQQKLNATAGYLRDSLNETLSIGLPWISTNETRLVAQRKLEMLETFLGFPVDLILNSAGGNMTNETSSLNSTENDDFVEDFYADISLTDPLNYMQNYVEIRIWLAKKQLSQLFSSDVAFDFFDWPKFQYPSSSNAMYSEKLNHLILPVGVIDTSLLSPSGINSVVEIPSIQYSSYGVLMAQLMLEGFDEQGSYRSASGNIDPWWDSETRENYRNLTECFNTQYNDMLQEYGVDVGVDGMENVGENNHKLSQRNRILRQLILQNGALNLAYDAYQTKTFEQEFDELLLPGLEEYTPEQIFFLSFAQSQCTAVAPEKRKFLVENALENSVEFRRHWKCHLPEVEGFCRIF